MVHRAPFGSMERFVAVLLEHCAGDFPLWLAPDQVIILPVSEKYVDYAQEVQSYLKKHDVRSLIDERNEKIGRKIRDAEVKKCPYMLIVGEREMNEKSVSVRRHGQIDEGSMTLESFAEMINNKVKEEQTVRK